MPGSSAGTSTVTSLVGLPSIRGGDEGGIDLPADTGMEHTLINVN